MLRSTSGKVIALSRQSHGFESRPEYNIAGWTGEVPAWSHKPNDAGSNPAPATKWGHMYQGAGDKHLQCL